MRFIGESDGTPSAVSADVISPAFRRFCIFVGIALDKILCATVGSQRIVCVNSGGSEIDS
jgi:hypothetical protein